MLVYVHRVVLSESHGETGEHWVAQAGQPLEMHRGRRIYKGWLKTANVVQLTGLLRVSPKHRNPVWESPQSTVLSVLWKEIPLL